MSVYSGFFIYISIMKELQLINIYNCLYTVPVILLLWFFCIPVLISPYVVTYNNLKKQISKAIFDPRVAECFVVVIRKDKLSVDRSSH